MLQLGWRKHGMKYLIMRERVRDRRRPLSLSAYNFLAPSLPLPCSRKRQQVLCFYPIRVDSVNRTVVLNEAGDIQTRAAKALGKENDTEIAKIAWLSNRDVPKAYGSMVVYLSKPSDAQRFLQEGFCQQEENRNTPRSSTNSTRKSWQGSPKMA